MAIDTHVHAGERKYGPIETFLPVMAEHGISKAVLVQHLGERDNDYLLDVADDHPGTFVVLAALAEDADQKDLDALIRRRYFRGVRLNPTTRSPGNDPLAVWRMLDDAELVVTLLGDFAAFASAEFAALVDSFPRITFRIEHVGSVQFAQLGTSDGSVDRFLELARFPNTYLMWSGFCKNSGDDFPYRNAHQLLERTVDVFGPRRIMWSGDSTRPGLKPGDYGDAIDLVRTELPFLTEADRAFILNDTALALFDFDGDRAR